MQGATMELEPAVEAPASADLAAIQTEAEREEAPASRRLGKTHEDPARQPLGFD